MSCSRERDASEELVKVVWSSMSHEWWPRFIDIFWSKDISKLWQNKGKELNAMIMLAGGCDAWLVWIDTSPYWKGGRVNSRERERRRQLIKLILFSGNWFLHQIWWRLKTNYYMSVQKFNTHSHIVRILIIQKKD